MDKVELKSNGYQIKIRKATGGCSWNLVPSKYRFYVSNSGAFNDVDAKSFSSGFNFGI